MNNGQKSLSINETFIVESENDGTMSACTGFFTNALVSCTGNTQIILGTNIIETNSAFSATTFYGDGSNLTGISTQDTFVTGGTYSEGTAIFTNNTGGTFNVTGFYTGATDVFVTGGTYSSGTTVFTNNTGGTFSITGFTNPFTGGDYVQFNTGATETIAAGKLYWNDVQGTINIGLKGGQTNVKSGVDLVVRVVNKVTPNTTLTKAAYQAVRISGAQAQRLAVELAQANNDNNSADTIGLVCETIATNQEGYIMTVGQLENVNTTGSLQGESWSDGDVLYLSPTTAGRLTNIRPSAPNKVVIIGFVEYAHSQNGKIYVRIDAGLSVNDLDDVNTNSVVNGQVLTYEGGLWVNKTPVAGVFTGGTVSGFTNFLSGLDSTSITLSDDNGFSSLNGSYWEMFNNDGYYLNLSNVGLTFNDLFSNTIYNAVGMYVANDTDYSEYLSSKIKQNGIEYFLPTGTTSQISTKADILSSVSGITLNNVATNGNSTGNSLIVTNGIYTTTHSNNGLVASFSGGSSTMNATQISTTNGSSTNTITSIKSSITEGVDTFEVTKSNLSISNSLSGFSVSVNITNGFTYNSTGGVYTNYSLNKITNNGIDYLLPTGTTSQIATKADITLRKRQIVNDTVTSTVSGTTTSTIVKSYQFLPETLTPSGFLEMYLLSIRTGASLAHTMNVFINTTNSLSGATLIGGVNTPGNFSPVFPMKLFFVLKDNLIVGGLVSQSTMTNLPSSATFVSAPCNNTINSVWILVTITPATTTQVISVQGVEIIN
jgi:hypothetical protein